MGTFLAQKWCTGLLLTSLILVSCSSKTTASITPPVASTTQAQTTQGSIPALDEIQRAQPSGSSTPVIDARVGQVPPTPSPTNTMVSREIGSYHAVLMLERAADLMLAIIEKIRAGQINQTDTGAISPYINAFAVAGDSLNQANPPIEFEDVWRQVNKAATIYNQAYLMLVQGTPISTKDIDYLEGIRQILSLDQQMIERWLAQGGLGKGFFDEQKEAVEKHYQQAYGKEPFPTLLP